MSKYTMTFEEYCQARHYAQLLDQYIEDDNVPEDTAAVWMQAVTDIEEDMTIAYEIISDEVFPDITTVPFYTSDVLEAAAFLMAFVDKFYFDEIGQETMARFKVTLRAFFREKMPYYKTLFDSKIADLTALASNYRREMTDDLTKSGTETDSLLHGHQVSFTPTSTQTNKIIPLGGSTETELNQSVAGGTDTTTNSGSDTTTHSFTNRVDGRKIIEEITGARGLDRAELVEKYRALILDIDSMIFADMRSYGLFMQVW